ncbi:hypothetical protein CP985_12130 [Malaciobacter mytili LMG 24559]|uniref:MmcQ/YjbR family DNA-binding protein n=1 Tax=Malaciobacter mytili LMG 24559 TaxID=1032238 RepID=A0AAX2ACG0_9BACT|nr:MmcQ/YjbR family DNA-binding protein [Malaciobacter mytili]AXH15410.1 YjbR domain-containing protein [Malaciobacter mytili LMG 24559]RXK14707.1 hypothetical protein CP985_12130 [Malaciobacter mytili LMG 24559]
MQKKSLDKFLLSKPCSKKEFPFGEEITVFKVKNKMFALYWIEEGLIRINLKCDPNDALAYREIYSSVIEGYHMNKKYWNTIILDKSIDNKIIKEMINESYNLVVEKLTKKQKEEIKLNKC